MSEKENKQIPVKVELSVKVDGKEVFKKTDDLLTKWFNRFMTLFISHIKLSVKRLDGTDIPFPDNVYWTTFKIFNKIAIGLDSTTPSGSDYNLKQTYMTTSSLSNRVVEETDNYIILDSSGNFSFTEDKTIYEFGLIGLYYGQDFLACRDVVPEGISVSNGQVLTITYRFIIGTYP
jgi:hypothetical protein